jgi:pimeloyl-ACP methyl ester carboxylesterase
MTGNVTSGRRTPPSLNGRLTWPAALAGFLAAALAVALAGTLGTARAGAAGSAASVGRSAVAAVWTECPPDELAGLPPAARPRFTCATYPVPTDYAHPAAGTTHLALLRRAAEDPVHRIGSLFIAAGGPGASGIDRLLELEGRLPAEVVRRFDLIGFDPRGVGRSDPLRCFTTSEQAEAVYGQIVGVPVTPSEISATLRGSRALTAACAAGAGPLLAHMSTLNVARDLDRLRQAAGDEKLNFLGYSYATLLGATYANLFPQRVRALVLDGGVDPELRTTDGMEYLRQHAAGAEAVVDGFLGLCAEAGQRCAFSGGDPRAKFAEIRQRLRLGPVTVPGAGPVDLTAFTARVGDALYDPEEYPELAADLQTVYEAMHPGTPSTVHAGQLAGRPAAGTTADATGGPYLGSEAGLAVNCLDEPFPRRQAVYPTAAAHWERQSPTAGRPEAFSQLACATWPVRDAERYSGPWDRATPNPVLLFANRHDPATNLAFNTRTAASLGSATLVEVDIFGHTVIGKARSRCADSIAGRYLTDLVLPPPGTVCPADAQPFG